MTDRLSHLFFGRQQHKAIYQLQTNGLLWRLDWKQTSSMQKHQLSKSSIICTIFAQHSRRCRTCNSFTAHWKFSFPNMSHDVFIQITPKQICVANSMRHDQPKFGHDMKFWFHMPQIIFGLCCSSWTGSINLQLWVPTFRSIGAVKWWCTKTPMETKKPFH